MLRRSLPVTTLVGLSLLAPAHGAATTQGEESALRYVVRPDRDLERMDVEVCFRGPAPVRLVPGRRAAGEALVDARDARGRALSTAGGGIDLSGVTTDGCIRYRVDVERARRASRFSGRWDGDLMTSAGTLLWRPARLPRGGATLRFELPRGLAAATPWPRERGVHRLDASAFTRPSFLAVGRFEPLRVERAGAVLEAVRLGGGWRLDDAQFERFLARAADGVSTVQGRFPVDRLLVVMVPSPGRGIDFGMVRRGGGHSVAFVAGRESTAEDLERSWVTWHELSHLHLPALPTRDAWLYEGLATYYQEVLRARLGIESPADAWRELLEGLDRGEGWPASGRTLARESESMLYTGAFMRVYWAGTAFALESDVLLRRRGSSLDRAITEAAVSWRRRSTALWNGADVCALWDRSLERALLRPLSERYASHPGFPATGRLLRRLGVHREGGRVVLRDAELAAVRDAIMRAP